MINNNLNNLGLNNPHTHYIKSEVRAQNLAAQTAPVPKIQSVSNNPSELLEYDAGEQKRQTYGLAILELMSEQEYQAWLRATAGMTETEKMLAVQKLYPLADIDRIKAMKAENLEKISRAANISPLESSHTAPDESYIINANRLNGMKAFSVDSNFIQRYKNAFDNLSNNVHLEG